MNIRYGWKALSLMLLFLLAACGSPEAQNPDKGTLAAGLVDETGIPETAGVNPEETVPLDAPTLASSLLGMSITDRAGQPAGQVEGFVLDSLNGLVPYLGVHLQEADRSVIVPWTALSMVVLPPGSQNGEQASLPVLLSNVSAEDLSGAPVLDPAVVEHGQPAGSGWDTQIAEYWNGRVPEMPVTGDQDNSAAVEQPGAPVWVGGGPLNGVDMNVHNLEGQEVAELRDLVILPDGEVIFGILNPDPSLEMGEGAVPVPWQGLSYLPEEREFLLNLPVEALKQAPRLSPDSLPDMTLPGWTEDWSKFWTTYEQTLARSGTDTPEVSGSPAFLKASDLYNALVVDPEGQELGQVADLDLGLDGSDSFIVVHQGDRFVPVSWSALEWATEQNNLVFRLDPSTLEGAPAYASLEQLAAETDWSGQSAVYWSDYLAVDPQVTPSPEAQAQISVPVSNLLGQPVTDVEDHELGILEDILLSPLGEALYPVIQAGERHLPVPWMVFEYDDPSGHLVYLDDSERFAEAPGFPNLSDIDLSAPGWDAEIRGFWGMK